MSTAPDLASLAASQDRPPPQADPADNPAGGVDSNSPATTPPPVDSDPPDPPSDPPDPDPPPNPLEELALLVPDVDLSKYHSFEDAIRGLGAAGRMVGQRNEDASAYQQLRDTVGEERLSALLTGEPPKPDEPPPPTRDEVSVSQIHQWQAESQAGTLTDDNRRKLDRCLREAEEGAFDLRNIGGVEGIKSIVEEAIGKFSEHHAETVAKERASQDQQTELQQWMVANGKELFVDPAQGHESGLTPLGQVAERIYQDDPRAQALPENSALRVSLALDLAKGQLPAAKTPPKPSRTAQRVPDTKGTPKELTDDEWMEANRHLPEREKIVGLFKHSMERDAANQ